MFLSMNLSAIQVFDVPWNFIKLLEFLGIETQI